MAPKNKGLGRGLDALLATSKSVADKQTQIDNDKALTESNNELKKIPIEFLQPGKYQPRKDMADDLLDGDKRRKKG